ncbi:hypothetical protein Lal_00039891, partial [Lupinus albus]
VEDMGECCSHGATVRGKVESEVDGEEYEHDHSTHVRYEHDGSRVILKGSSMFVSLDCQQGKKGVNQDALTVWEDFTGEKDMIFCGVFDGHGPLGHKVSQFIRDKLPLKLSESIKMAQQNACRFYDAKESASGSYDDIYEGNNQGMSLAAWEACFLKFFDEIDEKLAQEINTYSYCSGSTAVTVIKQGDQLIVGNLGDSRAVLCTRGDRNQLIPVQLTVDLKPDIPSEASRIITCEGRVFASKEEPDVYRIWMPDDDCPGLAMSRGFGDFCIKDYGLISTPDVFYRKLTKQDEFVVLATDGVWDVLTNSEVINIVASAPRIVEVQISRSISHEIHRNRSKNLFRRFKSTRNEETERVDGKVGLELDEEWKALGGFVRSNSILKLPWFAKNLNERQALKYFKGGLVKFQLLF